MKKFWMAFIVAVMGVTVAMSSAEAKRLGGGGSFGKPAPSYSRQAPAQQQATPAPRPAQPAAPAASPWKGILGGALLGLGLGALFSHLGIGGELAGMLSTVLMIALLALAAMFIYRLLTRKSSAPPLQPAYDGPAQRSITPEIGENLSGGSVSPATGFTGVPAGVPADFDTTGFLRHAKTNFLRMQAAWDKADVHDIREFTTPEMFAELKMQLSERGTTANHTDVVSLDAELLGIETTASEHLASVRFHGMIRESEQGPTEPLNGSWVLAKPVSGQGGWLLAGLQQA